MPNAPSTARRKFEQAFRRALTAVQRGDLGGAESAATQALAIQPENPEVLHLYAEISQHAGRPLQALRAMFDAIERDFESAQRWGAFALMLRSAPPDASITDFLRERFFKTDLPERQLTVLAFRVLRESGFHKEMAKSRVEFLYRMLALPWLGWASRTGRHNLALNLEDWICGEYVKQTETEAHFRNCYAEMIEPLRGIGLQHCVAPCTTELPNVTGKPRVAFLQQAPAVLAHTEVVLSMLEGWAALPDRPFECIFVCLYGKRETAPLADRLAQLGVRLVCVERDGAMEILQALRDEMRNARIDALVWLSAPVWMATAFSMRVAPLQVWWAMKYHCLAFPEIDCRLANGSFEQSRNIGGLEWPVVHAALSGLARDDLTAAATHIRAGIPAGLVLGCMGREEKLDNPEFLSAIADVLEGRPDAVFVWTGRHPLESVTRFFANRGLAQRHRFVGWIDTRLYARVIDIYLDTFPFGGGHTVFQSMAAGVPVVMFKSAENLETGVPMHLLPVVEGRAGTADETADVRAIFRIAEDPLLLIASSPAQYAAWALRLIDEPAFRKNVGEAGRIFVEKYLGNLPRFAASFAEKLTAMLAQHSPSKGH